VKLSNRRNAPTIPTKIAAILTPDRALSEDRHCPTFRRCSKSRRRVRGAEDGRMISDGIAAYRQMRDNQDSRFGMNKSLERWLSAALDRVRAADAADFGAKP
jgi:hypothetical protein